MIANFLKIMAMFLIALLISSIDFIADVVFKGSDWLFCLIAVLLLVIELLYFRWKDNR